MRKAVVCLFLLCCVFVTAVKAGTAKEILKKKGNSLVVGIVTAVSGESGRLLESMQGPVVSSEKGKRIYQRGKLHGIDTVLVSSRIGKVAAAATAVQLILEFNVDIVIFIGVAGAIDPRLNVGDIVIANALIQHDMDARPFCQRYEIPLLKIKECYPDPLLQQLALQAAQQCVEKDLAKTIPSNILREFQITQPKVATGLVVTGDQVISQEEQKVSIKERLSDALCVEMEGASISQVSYEYDIPCVIIRTISDYANHEKTQIDVKKFVTELSGKYSEAIIKNLYALMNAQLTH